MAAALWPFIQDETAGVRPRLLTRPEEVPAADQPHIRDRVMQGAKWASGDQHRTGAVRPATLWRCVVLGASARGIAGRMVVSRRASLDWPAPGAEQDVCPLTRGATTGTRHAAAGQAQGRA